MLIYASRPSAPQYRAAQSALTRLRMDVSPLWISHQVLREYLAAATRPQASGAVLLMKDAITDVRRFRLAFNVLTDDPSVFERLLHLIAVHPGAGKQVHDANLVATMLTQDIFRLLTFNTSDFRRFGSLIKIVTP